MLTNPPEMLKSAIKTAKVWQFVYVATKLQRSGSLYPRKKVWLKLPRLAVLIELFKLPHSGRNPEVTTIYVIFAKYDIYDNQ